ncbi:DUF389 domain-containing protein [Agromyces sp. CFH 90414]|uniref:DUF389 domain-containing protein n=1 Tax=Agromyces agglutinans TaxID=2662258 RepID=A0A6I2F823_9MICO|nr:DUF389 domain-containing protein [Agromyces agglutinans]MRG58920.1 DUF389 domain-containing protein [Agromyces agglutinans]
MRSSVFFEGPTLTERSSRFWILLGLASVIAAAGVVGDSTATVIGAMIVAPLMTPILGVVLATVLGDRANLLRCWTLVIGGAAAAIAIGYLVGLLVAPPVVAATNDQVASRVTPSLIDLLAALATGLVGAIALIRKDISDTLPGVAIAISLVPPLTVVGLAMESGAFTEALGALLLFVANVAAILATGVIVLLGYRIGAVAALDPGDGTRAGWGRGGRAIASVVITLAVIGVPLAVSSVRFTDQSLLESSVRTAVEPWVGEVGWELAGIEADGSHATVTVTGTPPLPDTGPLEDALRAQGVEPADVTLELIPAYRVPLGGDAG